MSPSTSIEGGSVAVLGLEPTSIFVLVVVAAISALGLMYGYAAVFGRGKKKSSNHRHSHTHRRSSHRKNNKNNNQPTTRTVKLQSLIDLYRLKGVPTGSALLEAFNGQFSSREKFYSRIQNYSGDTYYNARKSFLSIAYQYETSKVTSFVLQDKEQTCAVALSVIAHPVFLKKKEVLSDIDKLKIGIPCIFRQNKRDNLDPNDLDLKKWICLAQIHSSKMAQITCTPEEQELILIHLRYNASKLSESCRDRFMDDNGNFISTFTFSYVSPMFENPVAKAIVAKANEAQICPKCGVNEASLTCSRCKIQNYCSKACQKRDWKEHKQICRKPESKLDNSDYIDVDVGKIDPRFESFHSIVASWVKENEQGKENVKDR